MSATKLALSYIRPEQKPKVPSQTHAETLRSGYLKVERFGVASLLVQLRIPQVRIQTLAQVLSLTLVLALGLLPQPASADIRCCMAEPKILPDGMFKYTEIPFRLTRPAIPIQGFNALTPSAPQQPEAPSLGSPAPLAMPQGPRSDFAVSPLQAPSAPSR